MNEREKAQALVAAYAKHTGKDDPIHLTLDANNDRSFGDFGFHYFPEKDVLQARVLIIRTSSRESPTIAEAERQSLAGLNDPTIGGMYDKAGGYFVADPEKQMLFLVRDFPVATTATGKFINQVDALYDISGIWIMKWLGLVANQSHGAMPKPTQHIDREHDPYPRQ